MSQTEAVLRVSGFDVTVNARGEFSTEVLDLGVVKANTMQALFEKIERLTKVPPVRVEIPFTLCNASTSELRNGVLTGIHAGSGNIMARYEGSRGTEQLTYNASSVMRRFTGEDATEWRRLIGEQDKVAHHIAAFRASHSMNAMGEVKKAIAEKQATDA